MNNCMNMASSEGQCEQKGKIYVVYEVLGVVGWPVCQISRYMFFF
jgi:hypothetical protein